MENKPLQSTVYLMRCWAEPYKRGGQDREKEMNQDSVVMHWRFRFEEPRSGKVTHFLSIGELTTFLEETFRSYELPDSIDPHQIAPVSEERNWINRFPSVGDDQLSNQRIYNVNQKKETPDHE